MGNPTGTGVVNAHSDLVRQKWMREGLIQAASKSFWTTYQGNNCKSIVYQENDISAKEGHTVVFDFSGNLTGKAVKGKETASGTGEQKKKFSDKVSVDRFRFVVDNGDKFDGVNIGDLSINEHTDSRDKLADLWVRVKDQAIFDTLQQGATHAIQSGTLEFDDLLDVENIIKTGNGYKKINTTTAAAQRLPMQPFTLADGRPVWLVVIDSPLKNKLLKSDGGQNMLAEADVRGNDNRLIKGVIGKIGNFLFVEAETFFGVSKNKTVGGFIEDGYAQINKTEIQMAGLRGYTAADGTFNPTAWTGEPIAAGAKKYSRGLILGAGAMQLAMGKSPDYKFQASSDFSITTESALEVWCGFKPTKYKPENDDYAVKIGGISNGIIALDIQLN